MTRSVYATFTLLACAALLACSNGAADGVSASRAVPDNPPDIRGTITRVTPGGGSRAGAILIEEDPAAASGSEKAYVEITPSTRLHKRAPGGASIGPMHFSELRPGQPAEAWFTGPVRESYPVQATARTVIVTVADAGR